MKTVKDFMSAPAQTISFDSSIQEAAKLMKDRVISSLIVLDGNKTTSKPVGIVTERDFVQKFCTKNSLSKDAKIGDICSKKLFTIPPETEIKDVCKMLDKKHIRHVIVANSTKVLGIITIRDILDKIF
jgi:signal-transduction protein with cAMP-binding, CBS, and nucleotidyltransferase domain